MAIKGPSGAPAVPNVSGDPGGFTSFNVFVIFLGVAFSNYQGLTWMKNVFVLPRDVWYTELSTPYSGQLFPTGGSNQGPGQIFPF